MRLLPAKPRTQPTARNGFIVVAVLWILGALAALVSIYSIYVTNAATGLGLHEDRLQGEALVSAALELTAYQLAPGATARPAHGEFSFRSRRASVAVAFQSEAARVDLNVAPRELLAGMFLSLGAPPDDAQYYANRIIGWRTAPPPNGDDQEAAAYRAARLSYAPRGAPFPDVNELSLVLGLPSRLVERALPLVTVFSGRAQVNVFDASAAVIAGLPGLTQDRARAFLAQRALAPDDGKLLLSLLGPAQAFATTDSGNITRVSVHIAFDNGRKASAEVVILMFANGKEPYSILSWVDDSDRAGA